jgi:hypothetical protein
MSWAVEIFSILTVCIVIAAAYRLYQYRQRQILQAEVRDILFRYIPLEELENEAAKRTVASEATPPYAAPSPSQDETNVYPRGKL